jgi:S-(hydroxymethyl)glutathione dehydrogenase/alcohol dehydrogenase
MIDVIIDTTGSSELISSVVPLLSDFGRLIMVGQPKPGERLSFLADSSFFGTQGKLIKSTQGGKTFPSTDILRYIDLYKSGFLDFEKVITHRFKLPDINDAFSLLKSGTAGRIIIEMDA